MLLLLLELVMAWRRKSVEMEKGEGEEEETHTRCFHVYAENVIPKVPLASSFPPLILANPGKANKKVLSSFSFPFSFETSFVFHFA